MGHKSYGDVSKLKQIYQVKSDVSNSIFVFPTFVKITFTGFHNGEIIVFSNNYFILCADLKRYLISENKGYRQTSHSKSLATI